MSKKISVITPTIRPNALGLTAQCLSEQTFKDFEWIVDINFSGKSDLNASLNRCVKRSEGEFIVFLQDYIQITPDGLQRFWDAYQENPKKLFTAPVAKLDMKKEPQWDWRKYRDEHCSWMEWEIDWGACAKDILYDVGGFDEVLDEAWGFDNVNIGLRAELKDYKFANLNNNLAYGIDHDAIAPHPFRGQRDEMLHNRRLDQIRMGLEIKYL